MGTKTLLPVTETRKRITYACDRCANKRCKCDGNPLGCNRCSTKNQECLYTRNNKKRGPPKRKEPAWQKSEPSTSHSPSSTSSLELLITRMAVDSTHVFQPPCSPAIHNFDLQWCKTFDKLDWTCPELESFLPSAAEMTKIIQNIKS
ncbi:hypothetical protein HDU91_001252 [Kappamyces sp. JEL0680]|nr:hypothetical protein HDU91_001252 [Kappamyces sp. JEL0680]